MAATRHIADLLVLFVLALAGLGGLVLLGPSLPALLLALPLLIFLPGYALVVSLYPRNAAASTMGFAPRIALAAALSAILVPTVAIGADYVTGIYPLPVVAGLTGLTGFLTFVAFVRRLRLPAKDRLAMAPLGRLGEWTTRYLRGTQSLRARAPLEARRKRDVFVNLLILGSILVFGASVGFAAMVPQEDPYTEAYLGTTADGDLTMVQDPAGLSSAQRDSLVAVVENHEGEATEYRVEILAQDVQSGGSGGQVTSSSELAVETKTVSAGDTWRVPVPSDGGADRTVVNVYKPGAAQSDHPAYQLVLDGN